MTDENREYNYKAADEIIFGNVNRLRFIETLLNDSKKAQGQR